MPSDPPTSPPPAPPPGIGPDAAVPSGADPPQRAGPGAQAAGRPEPGTSGPPPGVTSGGFVEARALHPASVVLGIPLRQLLQGVLVPALVGASAGPGLRFAGVIVAVILVLTLIGRFLSWRRFRFRFDGEVLRVDEGVITRNHRALDVARIQQVEVERSLIARVFGLAALRVETAGTSTDIEVELRVLPVADAEALRDAVRVSKAALSGQASHDDLGSDAADADRPPIISVGTGRIVAAAVTGSRLLVFPAVLAALTQFVGNGDGQGVLSFEAVVRGVLELGLVVVVALLIPLSLLTAIVTGVLRDHGWTMRRQDDDLHVRRGLLSTRESVLPLHRVQLVEIQRNWLRRALGVATLRIHSAGGSGGDERKVSVPLLRDDEVDRLIAAALPGVPGVPALVAHPPAARRRALFRWLRDAAIVASAAWLIPPVPQGLRYAALAWIPVSAALAVVEYRQLATGRSDRVVASRRGALSVTTQLAPLVKVQAVSTTASWFQRRLGLATVQAHVAGPGGDLTALDLGQDTARELHAGLSVAAADPLVPEAFTDADELTGADVGALPGDGGP